jgi:UDP-N-acetyl-D-glucosamine dehydrogenase
MVKVCIIGLGYVGLPLACLASQAHEVFGVDIDEERVRKINSRECPTDEPYTKDIFHKTNLRASTDFFAVSESEVVLICVPTPITDQKIPNLNPIKSAITSVAENLRKGEKKPLIIIESTIYPGTTEEELIPLLEEKSGLKFNEDFSIVYCPERIDPGNLKWNLANIPRVIGATNKEDGERSQEFYSSFIEAEITLLNSIKSAEATKILENSFRDVNIAFINEMAKSFEKFGINILEVIKGASTKPFGYMPFYPGPGVGGHCIPVDPYYLIERSKKNEFDHQFLILARKINESMPNYVVEMLQNELNKQGIALNGAKVGLYGIAYKKNMEDVRNSPSLKIHELLENRGVNLNVYDPYVNGEENNLQNFLKKIDYLIIGTDHDEIVNLPREEFLNIKLIIDSRNCLKKEVVEGINYCGLGNALGTFGAQPEKKK